MSSIISGFLSVSLVFGLFFLFLLKNFYQKLLIFFFYFLKNYFIFNFWGMFDPNFFLHPNFALCHNIKKIQIHCYLHLEINNYTPVLNYRCHQLKKNSSWGGIFPSSKASVISSKLYSSFVCSSILSCTILSLM